MVKEWNKLGKMPVYFNGYDLSDYLNVISLDRGIGVNRVNNLLKAGIQKGKRFSSFTYDEKEIPMGVTLVQDLISKRRELAGILNVNEPKELIFGDEPDKFYMAIPDGNVNLDELAQIGRGSIKWLVPDGVAHSIEPSTFIPTYVQPDKINVINRGTEICKPLLEATMRSDNGLVAFIDSHENILQFGNPESLDTETYKTNETVINENMRTIGNWQLNKGLQRWNGGLKEGSYLFGQGSIQEEAWPQFLGKDTGWNGPSLYQPVPVNPQGNSKGNWEMKTRFYFGQTVKDVNRVEYSVMNDSTTLLPISVCIMDDDANAKNLIFEIWAYGKAISIQNLMVKKFSKNFFELIFTKIDDTITIKLSEINNLAGEKVTAGQSVIYNIRLPEFKDDVFKGITIWNSKYKRVSTAFSAITDFKFTWLNVDKIRDVSNIFKIGDVLWADTENGKIYLNGVYTPELDTLGNMWGNFHVGANSQEYITVVSSSWVEDLKKPLYSAKIREVWV